DIYRSPRENFAMVANSESGLAVIDLSDFSLVGNFPIGGVNPIARRVVISGKYAYVGVERDGTTGYLSVMDISNPTSPTNISYFQADDFVWDIEVQESYVYMGLASGIEIVDVSDPYSPQKVSTLTLSRIVDDVEINGNYLYAAAEILYIIDVSDPYSPQIVGTFIPGDPASLLKSVTCYGDVVYAIDETSDSAGVFALIDNLPVGDRAFAERVSNITSAKKVYFMQPCYGGVFKDELKGTDAVFVSATDAYQFAFRADDIPAESIESWQSTADPSASWTQFMVNGSENEIYNGIPYYHGEFDFHFQNALRGETPVGDTVNADADGNRFVSIREAWDYFYPKDSWRYPHDIPYYDDAFETPQYSDPGNIGSSTYLVWDDFKPPASPRGVTYTFGRIGDTLLIHFEWLMNKEIDFSGYRIYRNTALVGDVHDSVFCDTLPDFIPGDIDTYFVTSYDVYGYESTPISIEIRYPLGLLTSAEDLNFSSQNKLALAYNKWVYVYSDGGQTKGIASFDGHTWSRPVRIGHMRYPSLYVWAKLLFPNVLAHYWTAGNTGYKLWGADSMEWWSLLETSDPSLPEEWNYVLLEDYVDPTQPDPYPMPIAPSLALNSNGNICLAMLLNSFGEGSILYREYLRGDWNSPTEWEVVDSLVSMPWYPPSLVGYYGIHVVWGDKEDVYYSTRDLTGNWTQPWKINMLAFPAYEPSLSYKGDKLYCVWIEENTVTGKKRIAWQEGWLALPPEIRWAYTYPSYMEVDGDPHHPRMVEGTYLLFEMDGKVYLTDTTGNVIFTDKGYGPQAQYHDGEVHLVYGKTHGCEILTNTWISVAEIPFIAVKIGDSIPSPYVIERDGYLVYPSGISVDYDTEELMYEIPFLDTLYDYTLQIVGYHESSGIWKEKVKIDGKKGRMLRVKAGIPETLSIKIPFPYYRDDGKIVVTIERYTGDYASVASIALYAEERRSVRSGGPLASGTTEPKISFYARALRSMGGNAVIEYAVPHDSRVKIEIYDVVGRMVENHSGYRSAGVYRYTWSGKPGVYFYRIRAGEKEAKGRFMILK
ncbi:hypothetical protein DRQ18_01525, partial [bacterium]